MVEDEPLVRSTSLPHSKAPALTWDRREPKKKRYTFDTTLLDAALLDANLCGHPVDEIAAALGACNVHFLFVTGYGGKACRTPFVKTAVRPIDEIGQGLAPKDGLSRMTLQIRNC